MGQKDNNPRPLDHPDDPRRRDWARYWDSNGDRFDGVVRNVRKVPEPTTLALMGLSLAGIGYRRHRSKKAA